MLFEAAVRFHTEGSTNPTPAVKLENGCDYTSYWGVGPTSVKTTLTMTNHSGSGTPLNISATNASGVPWFFVYNLTAGNWGTWSVTVAATYSYTTTVVDYQCPLQSENSKTTTSTATYPVGYPESFTLTVGGSFITSLEIASAQNTTKNLTVVIGPKVWNATEDAYSQNNALGYNGSILSTRYSALNYTIVSQTYKFGSYNNSAPYYRASYNDTYVNATVSTSWTYHATVRLSTENGTPLQSLSEVVNANWLASGPAYSPSLGLTWSCNFIELPNPIVIGGNESNASLPGITGITATTANITWISNYSGEGWVAYHELGGTNFTTSTTWEHNRNSRTDGAYPYQYQTEIHGLHSWGVYTVQVGVASTVGCLTYENWATWHFQTLTQVIFEERDQPYDSITQQGGGAIVQWQVPLGFLKYATFESGAFDYWPSNASNVSLATVSTPLQTLPPWIPNGPLFMNGTLDGTYGENLSALNVSWNYSTSLLLNFTVAVPWGSYNFTAGSLPFEFWYLRDTSHDGLTDQEKTRGWSVTYENLANLWVTTWVTANPQNKSTNGLVNDYVEKQFGLNPRTVDTAGSHMLDTWNLTFDLGPKSSTRVVPAGSDFRFWSEAGNNSSKGGDYSWSSVCQYFVTPGTRCYLGTVASGEFSNITDSDNSNWSSRVLWSAAALRSFVNLSGVRNASWLRAVLGNTSTEWTLTVSGKLSWGANPLSASTPHDGVADGSRVNAVYDEVLVIGSLYSNLTSCQLAQSGKEYGWAERFHLNWSTQGGPLELPLAGSYSQQGFDSHTACDATPISNYRIAIPVNATSQNQSLGVELVLNESNATTSSSPRDQKFTTGAHPKNYTATYDMVKGLVQRFAPPAGLNGGLSFILSTAPAGIRANTLLWLPTDNTTLNSLPWGLKRYTGEQGFALIVVNQSTGSVLRSDRLPYAQNSSWQYQLNLSPGLNSILVPRSQFAYSVFGEALLSGSPVAWTNASARPPLLGSDENSTDAYGSSNPLQDLACYWQNRALNNTTGSIPPICLHNATNGLTSETGTLLGLEQGLVTSIAGNGGGGNLGGVPNDPNLETSSEAGAALQAVVTLNISSTTEWDLLLAALLDNSSGGLNGTFLNVTFQVAQLGLQSNVTNSLANATQSGGGLWGLPWGKTDPTPKINGGLLNSVSGVLASAAGVISHPWSIVTAAEAYIGNHLPPWLKADFASVAARTAAGLRAAAALVVSALSALAAAVIAAVKALISNVVAPIVNGIVNYVRPVNANVRLAQNDTQNYTVIPTSLIYQIGSSLSGSVFEVGLVVGAVLAVALTISLPVDIGPELLVPVVIGLLITIAFEVAATAGLLSTVQSSFNQINQATFNAMQNYLEHPDPPNPTWTTVSRIALTLATMTIAFPIAMNTLANGKTMETTEYLTVVMALALMFSALAFFVAALSGSLHSIPPLAIVLVGLAVGILGILRMGLALSTTKNPALRALQELVIGMSAVNLGIGMYVALGSPGL
jgi:hypothetical protein